MTMAQLQPYMPFIILAIVGLVAGTLTGLLLGGKGLLRNMLVGIIGAFVGYAILTFTGLKMPYNFDALVPLGNSIAVATAGAILVTIVARIIAR